MRLTVWIVFALAFSAAAAAAPSEALEMTGDFQPPVEIYRVEPRYPELAKANRKEGAVVVGALIDREGNVTVTKILKSEGFGLDESAVEAVSQWKFKPATRNGEAVSVIFAVTVRFSLFSGINDSGSLAYEKGDYRKALKEWKRQGDQGDAGAQYRVELMYEKGEGCEQNYEAAAEWYRKAAKGGNARAQVKLAAACAVGNGVAPDDAEAAKWYKRAANQGNVKAQLNLGAMYARGRGVEQDLVQAYYWFHRPAAVGNEEARRSLDSVKADMEPDELEQARRLVQESQSGE